MTVRRVGHPADRKRFDKPFGRFALASGLEAPGAIDLQAAVDLIAVDWQRQIAAGNVSVTNGAGFEHNVRSFCAYAIAHGIARLDQIRPTLILEWMHSPTERGEPANGTRLHRRAVMRTFFDTAECLGLYDLNPARSVHDVRKYQRHVSAFTPAEIEQIKRVAEYQFGDRRTATIFALQVLGATARESSHIRVGDVDLAARRVWLHGGAEYLRARWVPMDDEWAFTVLRDRLAELRDRMPDLPDEEFDQHLIGYKPRGPRKPGRTGASQPTAKLLKVARVKREGTRPDSIREYVAAKVFAETGRLEAVAIRLGFASLDTVAHIVGYDWRDDFGIHVPPPPMEGELW